MTTAFAERVQDLTGHGLSRQEVGQIVGTDGRTVARWASGATSPQTINRDRLLQLHYVAFEAANVFKPDAINIWIFSPNRMLGGDSPADCIRDGRYKDVLAVLEALQDGVSV
jgi:transcriptional regulator with XRE-family HTH domain